MLNHAKTTSSSTIVSVESLSCISNSEGIPSSHYMYAIGPIDPAQFTSVHVPLSIGTECLLLFPVHLPPSLLTHPVFKQGYESGYSESNPEEEIWTVPKLMNDLYRSLADLGDPHDLDLYCWTLGFVLGQLASVAEQDRTLALTGLAHCCFLLPLFTQARPLSWPRYEPCHAHLLHRRAMKAYRTRVHALREQGRSFAEAQRLALVEYM